MRTQVLAEERICTTAVLLVVLNPLTSTAEDPYVEMRSEEVGLYGRDSQDPGVRISPRCLWLLMILIASFSM